MKKLMTTVSAVALAFGLYATNTGTSFEGLTGDAPYDIYASTGELTAQAANQTYWVTNGTETLTVVEGVSDEENRPAPYEDATQTKYLNIKTTLGNPVTRNVSVGGAGTSIGTGFYFDSLVKFTAFDEDPAINLNGGKLAVWIKEVLDANDNPTATNLVVTAGFLDGQGGAIVTNYTCAVSGVNLDDGGWHRVTVKAIADITNGGQVPGFVVYVDKVRATSGAEKGIDAADLSTYAYLLNSEGSLFPSAVQSGQDKDKIAAVAFDGQGDVDDLLFTADAPDFAKDATFFSIYLGEHVTSVQGYDPDGNVFTIGGATNFVYGENKTVQILDWTCDTGWMKGSVTNEAGQAVSGSYTITDGGSITVNAKKLGATLTDAVTGDPVGAGSYETLAAAKTAINGLASGNVKLTLNDAAATGFELDNAAVSVVLDLAGNNITAAAGDAAAISLVGGTLLVTNSTVTVGEVNKFTIDGEPPTVIPAVTTAGGALTIAGGIYNGAVDVSAASPALITGGEFSVDDNKVPGSQTTPPAVNTDLAAAAAAAGNELVVGSGSASYYTVQAKAAATVNVTVTGGANATAVWTVNGATVSAPSTLNQGDTYSVVYTADAGYAFEAGATTSASGTAGSEDITITIANAVQAVAQIEGGARYATLKAAVDAASAGATVTVLANCVVDEPITFNYGINLVNNYEVTLSAAYALRLANGTTTPVTVSGTGAFLSTGTGSPFLVGCNEAKSTYGIDSTFAGSMVLSSGTIKRNDGSNNMVKLEYGTFVMNGGSLLGGSRGVKADADVGSFTSTLTINGGVISNGVSAAVAASAESGTATVTINGGDIIGKITCSQKNTGTATLTIPGTSTARFDADRSTFCATGYCTTLSSGWYVVSAYPTYLAGATDAVKTQYRAWAGSYGADTTSAYEGDFLLNVEPQTVGATINVTAIAIDGTTVTIDINRSNLNGVPYVKKAATVAGLTNGQKVAVTITPADQLQDLDNGGRITLENESGATQFYQVGVQSTPVAVPNN